MNFPENHRGRALEKKNHVEGVSRKKIPPSTRGRDAGKSL